MLRILPTFFHLLISKLGRILSDSVSLVFAFGLCLDPRELPLEDDLTLLSREALRRLILSSKIIFLLDWSKKPEFGFWASSSHQAKALHNSFFRFLYFLRIDSANYQVHMYLPWIFNLAGLIRFKALSANSLDFSPTLESLGAGVAGLLFRIPFTGVGLNLNWNKK